MVAEKLMEGRTHSCEWKKGKNSYRLWVVADPSLSVESKEFDDGRDLLSDKIAEKLGDIDPTLEFSRYPASIIPSRYARPRYVWLGRNAPGHLAGPIESIFVGGYCQVCQWPCGERTCDPIRVEAIPAGADALNIARLNVAIYSRRLLKALGVDQSSSFSLLAVEAQESSDAKLFEVRPRVSQVLLRPVAVKDFAVQRTAWRCSGCQSSGIHYDDGNDLIEFVAASEVSKLRDGVFIFEGRLCVPRKAWLHIAKHLRFQDVYARPLGVALEDDIDRSVPFDVIYPSKKRTFGKRK